MITRFAVPKAFKIEDIERETRKEHLLNMLKSLIINNNWYILNEPQKHKQFHIKTLKHSRLIRTEPKVNTKYNIILKGNRIVLPSVFHKQAIKMDI